MVPRHRTGEFFGMYGVLDKVGGATGPFVFATMAALSGSSRVGIVSILGFFVIGSIILTRVDVEAGRKAAREAERDLVRLG
jgi:UMF1 family MFS transporter